MTPNVRGAVGAIAKLRQAADERAQKLIARIEAAGAADAAAHQAVHAQLDELEKSTAEMEALARDLGGNGGPPLEQGSAEQSEPHKSWVGDKPQG